uniref:Uncharacterized protein n=1 Tax=Ditylenchus dipsaci TaxID=166011 RepID=A0A915D5U7_9BILA
MASGYGSPQMKNPAPHRGFNNKAREILLDPVIPKLGNIARSGSDEEFLRKVSALKQLSRTDSEQTNGSQKSCSSHCSGPASSTGPPEFDGKTRSAGDLFKNSGGKKTQISKTFQQLNIMKLPSVDSDIGASSRSRSLAGFDNFDSSVGEDESLRQTTYEVK